jgi:hypothetical protein
LAAIGELGEKTESAQVETQNRDEPIVMIADDDFGSMFGVDDRSISGDCGRGVPMLESLRPMFASVRKCPNMNA